MSFGRRMNKLRENRADHMMTSNSLAVNNEKFIPSNLIEKSSLWDEKKSR
jgi:hypothetical protein